MSGEKQPINLSVRQSSQPSEILPDGKADRDLDDLEASVCDEDDLNSSVPTADTGSETDNDQIELSSRISG